ncbi:hypothetical protein JXO52_10870 [bacterium]|nr:hypothetical protein [bacterium]
MTIRIGSLVIIACMLTLCSCRRAGDSAAPAPPVIPDTIDGVVWEDGRWEHDLPSGSAGVSRGYHRAVLETAGDQGVHRALIPWRRHDPDPRETAVILVNGDTGKEIERVCPRAVTAEQGDILFQADSGSTRYYCYYLPYRTSGGYYPRVSHLRAAACSDSSWLRLQNHLAPGDLASLPAARVIAIQSQNAFHSFFPMEVAATGDELASLLSEHEDAFLLFPEFREYPVRMRSHIPVHWARQGPRDTLVFSARRGEYVTWQVAVYAPRKPLGVLSVEWTGLRESAAAIPRDSITCFNTGGIDLSGRPFAKKISVEKGTVQPLWFGAAVDPDQKPGLYEGTVTVAAESTPPETVHVALTVLSGRCADHGDDDPRLMSRLRWLNSTLGSDPDYIMPPYTPVRVDGHGLRILGRDITLGPEGLPARIQSWFSEEMTGPANAPRDILARPLQFSIIRDGAAEPWVSQPFAVTRDHAGRAVWTARSESKSARLTLEGTLEYDGMLSCRLTLTAREPFPADDMHLSVPMLPEAAEYMLGLGYPGQKRPGQVNWKWDITRHQEGVWLGAVNRGLQYVLRDDTYERPLNTNFYQQKPLKLPSSWYNGGRGGITITASDSEVTANNYSGARRLNRGDTLQFNIRFLITPFTYLDTKAHFTTRFVHAYVPVDSVAAWGGTVVNIHHANEINPYINYPFYNLEQQTAYISEAHARGIKVKLYNTIRELTYRCYELFALRSLGDEIFNDGEGGGHPWLQEHLQDRYHSAWHAWRVDDAAILNKGTSRWTNYYIEGLDWLARNQHIDGLYLDDIAFSRETVKRMVSVLNRSRPGAVIDLHSANQYNPRDGYINSAFLYMEHFPFITRLWFGEYFDYDQGPDYYLTEVSGIPFGLTGEMLQDGGHPYRGMLYGMTTRVYGTYDPRPVWRMWDEFGIAESRMIGYWVKHCPVRTGRPDILVTAYSRKNAALFSLASWSAQDETIRLAVDWNALGLDPSRVFITAPAVNGLQEYQEFDSVDTIPVPAGQGLFLFIQER